MEVGAMVVLPIGGITALFALLVAGIVWGTFWYFVGWVVLAVVVIALLRPSVRHEIAKGWRGDPPYG